MAFKIMPLGDSITYGVVNKTDTESGGYRTELWNLFKADSFDADLVGLMSNGPSGIDLNHEGHRGWRIDEIINGNTRIAGQSTVGNIESWLNTINSNSSLPDAVLVMLGTNDVLQDYQLSTAPDRIGQLIDKISAKAPNTQVLVSSILPLQNSTDNQQAQTFNSQLPNIIDTKSSEGKKVSFVDINSKLATSELADGVHPTIDGYTKIANAWYEALQPFTGIKKTTRIQAEDMTLTNYLVESNNSSALGRKLISLSGSTANSGTASFQYSGTAGNYDVVLGYYDENDGQSTLAVKIGDNEVDRWTLNKNLGSASSDSKTKTRRTVASAVSLSAGTTIQITGTKNGSEFGRVDYVELIPITDFSNTSLSANNITTDNSTTYSFNVTYADDTAVDVSSLDSNDVLVTGPNGFSQLATLVSLDNNSNGTPRTATYRINAPGDSWDSADNGSYTVTLQNNQVKDTTANFFTGGSLGNFQVNVPEPQTTIRMEAENMQRTGYRVETNSVASNSQIVSLYQSSTSNGKIKSTFTGQSGTYDVILGYFDENDGQGTLTTKIDGTQLAQLVLNQYLGDSMASSKTAVHKTIATELSLNNGASIEIEGIANQGEFARIDYIEFKPSSNSALNLINSSNTLII